MQSYLYFFTLLFGSLKTVKFMELGIYVSWVLSGVCNLAILAFFLSLMQ